MVVDKKKKNTSKRRAYTGPRIRDSEDERLDDLFSRRKTLDKKEWTEFYFLVRAVLVRTRGKYMSFYGRLVQDGASEEDLISMFFSDNLFVRGVTGLGNEDQYLTVATLPGMYKNYLIQITRPLSVLDERYVPIDDSTAIDSTKHQPDFSNVVVESIDASRVKPAITKSAKKLLASWTGEKEWKILYLARSWCPGKEGESMSGLAERFKIKSYHPKAQKLGITLEKTRIGDKGHFDENTIIGRWLATLPIKYKQRDKTQAILALKILCREALLRYRELFAVHGFGGKW